MTFKRLLAIVGSLLGIAAIFRVVLRRRGAQVESPVEDKVETPIAA